MACAAEAKGVIAIAGLQGRHDPALTHARELVNDGWLGEVLSVSVTMIGGGALAQGPVSLALLTVGPVVLEIAQETVRRQPRRAAPSGAGRQTTPRPDADASLIDPGAAAWGQPLRD